LNKASAIEPDNPEYPANIAQMFAQVNRWHDALPYAEKAAKLSFGNPEPQFFLKFVREKCLE